MKTCFSAGKLMKQFGNPHPFLKEPSLSTNPLFLSNFFMTPLFVQILRGGGNYVTSTKKMLALKNPCIVASLPKAKTWNYFN